MKKIKWLTLASLLLVSLHHAPIAHANFLDFFKIDIEQKEETKEKLKEQWETTKSKTRKFANELLQKLESELETNEYLVPDFFEFTTEQGVLPNVIVVDKLGLKTEIFFGIKEIGKSRVKKLTQYGSYRYTAPLLTKKQNTWTFKRIIDTKPIMTEEHYIGDNTTQNHQFLLHNERYYVEAELTLSTNNQTYTLPVPIAYEDFLQLKKAGSSAIGTRIYPLFLEK